MPREQLESTSKERECTELKNEQNGKWAGAEREQNERVEARSEMSKKDKEGREDEVERREMNDETTVRRSKTNTADSRATSNSMTR